MPTHRIEIPPKQHLADLKKMFKTKDIAHLYEVATRTVQLWLRIRELTDPRYDRIPQQDQRPLYDAILSGKTTLEQASEKYNVSPDLVRDYLLKFGPIPVAKRKRRTMKIPIIPDDVLNNIIHMYYLGLIDYEDAAEQLDVSIAYAKRLIRKNSVTDFERPTDEELEEVKDLSLQERCEHFAEFNPRVVGRWYQDLNRKKRKREGVSA